MVAPSQAGMGTEALVDNIDEVVATVVLDAVALDHYACFPTNIISSMYLYIRCRRKDLGDA
ncbi:hypothetical protein KSX_87330 [Ktedonospora formicarum]|uniref:Uncharacterized protein n=1 Tax=Ktedonospora formicarum TaxID=2778364 RepID=A0A8J3MZ98_9CHLR|nr:hypothetical protein KSX_87330 [Ktedonospora formicarum]